MNIPPHFSFAHVMKAENSSRISEISFITQFLTFLNYSNVSSSQRSMQYIAHTVLIFIQSMWFEFYFCSLVLPTFTQNLILCSLFFFSSFFCKQWDENVDNYCNVFCLKGPELGAKHHFEKVYVMYSVVLYKEEFVLFLRKNVRLLCMYYYIYKRGL